MGAIAAHTDDRPVLRQVGIAARQALDGGPAVRRESMTTLAHAAWQRGNDVEAARWLGQDVDLLTTPTWPMDLDYVVLAARVAHTSSDSSTRPDRGGTARARWSARHAVCRRCALLEDDRDALDESVRILAESARPSTPAPPKTRGLRWPGLQIATTPQNNWKLRSTCMPPMAPPLTRSALLGT